MTDYMSQYDSAGVTLAAKGSAGDSYTFTVPNALTDSITSAWATKDAETGDLGLMPSGAQYVFSPTSFGYGANGEITSVTWDNLTDNYSIDFHFRVIYITPRP